MIGSDLQIPTRALMRSPPPGLNLDFATGVFRSDGADASSFGAVPGATFSRTGAGTAMTGAGAIVTFASGVPRITDRGLLLEEARTNSIRNSALTGAVLGAPGTAPTNWSINAGGAPGTIVTSIVGAGTQLGLTYIDVRFQGTAGGPTSPSIEPETTTQVVAANGDVWTASLFGGLVGGALPSGPMNLSIHERTSAGAQVASGAINVRSLLTGALQRFSFTRVLSGGGTAARINISLRADVAASEVVDFTLRIAQPDLQLGACVLSPIVTTTVAATRGADNASVTGLGSLLTPPYAVAVAAELLAIDGVQRCLAAVSAAGASANRIVIDRDGSNNGRALSVSGGVGNTAQTFAGKTGARTLKTAVRMRPANQMSAVDGSLSSGVAITDPVALDRVDLGQTSGGGGSYLNGYVQRVRILPGDISDAQLQALTQ